MAAAPIATKRKAVAPSDIPYAPGRAARGSAGAARPLTTGLLALLLALACDASAAAELAVDDERRAPRGGHERPGRALALWRPSPQSQPQPWFAVAWPAAGPPDAHVAAGDGAAAVPVTAHPDQPAPAPWIAITALIAGVLLAWHMLAARAAAVAARLRMLDGEVRAAREEERLRIARDLHDDLGATLTALKLELSGSDTAAGCARPRARRASVVLVDRAFVALRAVLDDLRPAALEHQDLWTALRARADEFERQARIPCQLVLADDLPQPCDRCAAAIYRMVEEALTNVARHADARHVRIEVALTTDALEVSVADDGVGIGASAAAGSAAHGLAGMHARMRALGGRLCLTRGARGGTEVRQLLPLAALNATRA